MKFTVREGFVLRQTDQKVLPNGEKIEVETVVVPGQDPAELDEATARAHLHKLEPADAGAKKFLEGIYEAQRIASATTAQATAAVDINAIVAAAVANALAAQKAAGA